MKGQESLFSQVFVLAISMFTVWITFVYSAFFNFNKNLQKNSINKIEDFRFLKKHPNKSFFIAGVNRLAYSCAEVMASIQAAELFSKLWSAEIINFFKKKKQEMKNMLQT